MMEEFSYTVSHDLRAPRRGMQAYSKALLEDCSDLLAAKPHAIESLQRIADNATRLDKMALDVLTFNRVTRGELRLTRVSLDKLVRDLVEHYPAMRPPMRKFKSNRWLKTTASASIRNISTGCFKYLSGFIQTLVTRARSVWSPTASPAVNFGCNYPNKPYP